MIEHRATDRRRSVEEPRRPGSRTPLAGVPRGEPSATLRTAAATHSRESSLSGSGGGKSPANPRNPASHWLKIPSTSGRRNYVGQARRGSRRRRAPRRSRPRWPRVGAPPAALGRAARPPRAGGTARSPWPPSRVPDRSTRECAAAREAVAERHLASSPGPLGGVASRRWGPRSAPFQRRAACCSWRATRKALCAAYLRRGRGCERWGSRCPARDVGGGSSEILERAAASSG